MKRVFGLGLVALGLGAAAPATKLTVDVQGLKDTKGGLIVCVWNDAKGFPTCQKGKPAARQNLPISATRMSVTFEGLAPGEYGVTVQHDEDGDGKLKTNFIGMPKEGIGVSNNPSGIPRYKNALVKLQGAITINVQMRYL
jgi:uncharacterized protein (DUF2141 family)